MKKIIFILFVGLSFQSAISQEKKDKPEKKEDKSLSYPEKVKTLDATVKNLYKVISGEKGEERDWKLFKYFFTNDAKLILTLKDKDGKPYPKYMSPADYIKSSGTWIVKNGFIEREIHREVHIFGNMAQVFSTYECYESINDEKPFMRGINSIQLFNNEERWYIVNLQWTQENAKYQIPKKYLR
ncbi:hypothetical protein [Neotamlana laminarinivorans]|uniref:Nuclear transport factor 2 family protein n=1 Tax=Neotamlana laminarinivorans TaxID=2883124 RepID=A0A9X1L675_9FLAO|nr:hypothetical protein [Tamlana laminarinivorans]MCB4800171.1 hypothetical protein [Tamlana laminarinivorans]